jgi:hypothetical protein
VCAIVLFTVIVTFDWRSAKYSCLDMQCVVLLFVNTAFSLQTRCRIVLVNCNGVTVDVCKLHLVVDFFVKVKVVFIVEL